MRCRPYTFTAADYRRVCRSLKKADAALKYGGMRKGELRDLLAERFDGVMLRKDVDLEVAFPLMDWGRLNHAVCSKLKAKLKSLSASCSEGYDVLRSRCFRHTLETSTAVVELCGRAMEMYQVEEGTDGGHIESFRLDFAKSYGGQRRGYGEPDSKAIGEGDAGGGKGRKRGLEEVEATNKIRPSDDNNNNNNNNSSSSSSSSSSATLPLVKSEPAPQISEYDLYVSSRPPTSAEIAIVSRLVEMGFTPLQSLKGCRLASDLYHHGMYPSNVRMFADEAMCVIVDEMEQKAEEEEIDRARVESERERDREGERQRENAMRERDDRMGREIIRDPYVGALAALKKYEVGSYAMGKVEGFGDAVRKIFGNGGGGGGGEGLEATMSDARAAALKFLKLESLGLKWYGSSSYGYIRKVCGLVVDDDDDDCCRAAKGITQIANMLEEELYSLERQEGGIPKGFRDEIDNVQFGDVEVVQVYKSDDAKEASKDKQVFFVD